MAITVRGCLGQGIQQQEEAYHQIFKNGALYHLNGDRLEIGEAMNPPALVYSRRPVLAMDPQKLVGTRWQLQSVDGHSLPSGATLILVFENGTVISKMGCYTYRSTYTAEGDHIRFPSTNLLGSDCDDPTRAQPGADISTATHYRLDAQQLEIETDDFGTLLFVPLPAEVTIAPITTATPVPTASPAPTEFFATPIPTNTPSPTPVPTPLIDSSPDGQWTATFFMEGPYAVAGDQEKYHVQLTLARRDGSVRWMVVDEVRDYGLGYDVPSLFKWSQDGRYLYFTNQAVPDGCGIADIHSNLNRVDLTTGKTSVIVPSVLISPKLSPDERTLAYLEFEGGDQFKLVLHDLANGKERSTEFQAEQAANSVWSPDGRFLILTFASHACDPQNWTQSLVRVDTNLLVFKTLIANDPRLFGIKNWSEASRVELQDKAGKLWWLDVATGTISAK